MLVVTRLGSGIRTKAVVSNASGTIVVVHKTGLTVFEERRVCICVVVFVVADRFLSKHTSSGLCGVVVVAVVVVIVQKRD